MEAMESMPGVEISASIDSLHAELGLLPPAQLKSDDDNDTTMPTWGETFSSSQFEYGTWSNGSSGSEDLPTSQPLELDSRGDSGSDSGDSAKSSCYDLAMDWSTDVGYTSGSEADIESDVESHPELDDLLQMLPMSSRVGSPIDEIDMGDTEEFEPEVSPGSNVTLFSD